MSIHDLLGQPRPVALIHSSWQLALVAALLASIDVLRALLIASSSAGSRPAGERSRWNAWWRCGSTA